jgi:hypothetical protein
MFTRSPRAIAAGIALFGILALGHEAAAELPRNPLVQTLLPTPEEATDFLRLFGAQVAVDGDTALVGMPISTGIDNHGSVPVFIRDTAGVWHRTDTLRENPASDLFFGSSIALDGDIAVINSSSTLFIFRRAQGVWTETTRLGNSFVTHYKGGYMVAATGSATGSAYYVYEVSPAGTVVGRTQITPPAPTSGFSVANPIAFDGRTLVLGLTREDDSRGAAYVYRRHGKRWLLEQKLIAINGESHDFFGTAAAIRGKHILIGAPGMNAEGEFAGGPPTQDGHSAGGAVVVFTRANGVWSERGRIRPSPDELFEYDDFGHQIVMRGGRTAIAAGEPYRLPFIAPAIGVVFVYEGRADALTATSLATFVGSMGGIALAPPRQLLLGSPHEIEDSDIAIGRVDVFSLPKRTRP